MNLTEALNFVGGQIPNPHSGLPEDVFLFISRITPMINVDLLIKDETGRTLLAWRDDPYVGAGWHIPGGIIRFKETFDERIRKVAETEIGALVSFNPVPVAVNQIIAPQSTRGHFISLLYNCFLSQTFVPPNTGLTKHDAGFLQWHASCPANLVSLQDIYIQYINAPTASQPGDSPL